MKRLILLVLPVALSACARGATLEGTLLDPDAATHVWVAGEVERARVEGGQFRLDGLRGDTVDLHFSQGDDPQGSMRLLGLSDGSRSTLSGIWFEEGIAFPTEVALAGERLVTVNGLRMGPHDRLGDRVEVRATLLARSGDGGALILRPEGEGLPDLRVLTTPATRVRTEDGDPVELDRLEFGDSLMASGAVEDGFLLAAEVVVPRRVAAPAPARGGRVGAAQPAAPTPAPAGEREPAAGGRPAPAAAEPVREVAPDDRERAAPPGRGRETPPGRGGPPRDRGRS